MVWLNGGKYACETCIRGHRSSGCKHEDRKLVPIKKKGRPVTQCEHCRELRKTKQVHVKCNCSESASRDDGPGPSGKKGRTVGPSSAAAATTAVANGNIGSNGAMASLAVDHSQVPSSQLAMHGQKSLPTCACADSNECKCWSIRKPVVKRSMPILSSPSSVSVGSSHSHMSASGIVMTDVPTSHIEQTNAALAGKSYQPLPPSSSSSIHSGNNIHSPTPQNAEYELSPGISGYPDNSTICTYPIDNSSRWSFHPSGGPSYMPQHTPIPQSQPDYYSDGSSQWAPSHNSQERHTHTHSYSSSHSSQPSTCGCGLTCACPGCAEHMNYNGHPSPSAYCTAGCVAGTGCMNSINANPEFVSISPEQSPAPTDSSHYTPSTFDGSGYLSHKASFQTFSSVATSESTHSLQSQLSGNGSYHQRQSDSQWMPSMSGPSSPIPGVDDRCTTGFATSGEREQRFENGSISPHHYISNSHAPSSASSSISFHSQQPHSQPNQHTPYHHPPVSDPVLPNPRLTSPVSIMKQRSHPFLPIPVLTRPLSPPKMKRTQSFNSKIKRLLPRPPDVAMEVVEEGVEEPQKYRNQVETLARAPPNMPFNRLM